MLQYDFEESLGYWIFSTAHAMSRALNEELSAHGITYRQWEVLAWLSYLGEVSQIELAESMRIEAPTLVGLLDRMERDDWIQRVQDPNDRRKKLIRPTDRVEPVWNRMVECAQRIRLRAREGLSLEQLDQLRDTLAAMRANLSPEGDLPPARKSPASAAAETSEE